MIPFLVVPDNIAKKNALFKWPCRYPNTEAMMYNFANEYAITSN